MLDSKSDKVNSPKRKVDPSNARDVNLLESNDEMDIEATMFERRKNYYIPSEPLGIKYFEKIWYIGNYKNTPFYIHITFPIYIISTLIYSMFHRESLSWFTLNLLLLICHCICIGFQIFLCLHIAKQFSATIHRILIWPFGYIGYAADYKQWTHFIIVEYAAPLVHIVIFVLFWGICVILKVANWNYLTPLHVYFVQNLLNGIWVINIIIASLHICIPVYAMKTARLMVNYLYRKRTYREVSQIILLPTAFMTIILLIFGIVDARPLPLFLSLWTIYQTYLLFIGNRKNLVSKLPLFQELEDALRDKRKQKKNSIDIVQLHRLSMTPLHDEQKQDETIENDEQKEDILDKGKEEDARDVDKVNNRNNDDLDQETIAVTDSVSVQDIVDVDTNDINKTESKSGKSPVSNDE